MRRRRPARSVAHRAPAGSDASRSHTGHGRGVAFPDRRLPLPRPRVAPDRNPPLCRDLLADRAPAHLRSHVGLPALQPPRNRTVRARLSARLSRGRGRADAALAPPEDARGAGSNARARRRRIFDPGLRQVRLLHDQGAARDLHRPVSPAPRDRARRRGAGGRHLMEDRIQIFSIIGAIGLLLVILELVRRRRLLERYALVWLGSGLVILALAIWRDALTHLASTLGIAYPPNALFVIAFGFVLLLLLHFSLAVSRLADQSKVLAQRLALLEERVHRGEPAREPDYSAEESLRG